MLVQAQGDSEQGGPLQEAVVAVLELQPRVVVLHQPGLPPGQNAEATLGFVQQNKEQLVSDPP